MSKVLITGSSGFVGKNLVRRLEEKSHEVLQIDAEYFQFSDWPLYLNQQLESSECKVIFHVGACSDTLEKNVQFMMERNYQSTKVISDWCRRNRIPLIYSSSAANFGVNGQYPSNLYGWSKYVAEDYVISNGGIALRYFNVFGPGEEHKGSMASFLYQALIKLRESQLVKLFPKEPRRDFVYIDDVISANIFAFENFDKLDKNYYEVSTGIASRFERVLEIAHINFEYSSEKEIPEGYQFYTCGNPERWMPGWQPKFSLESGVIDFLSKLSDSIDGRESQT